MVRLGACIRVPWPARGRFRPREWKLEISRPGDVDWWLMGYGIVKSAKGRVRGIVPEAALRARAGA